MSGYEPEIIEHLGNLECGQCGDRRPKQLLIYFHEMSFEDGIEHYICLNCIQEKISQMDYEKHMKGF